MSKLKKFLGSIDLVYRRSGNLTKIMVVTALALSLAAMLMLQVSIRSVQAENEALCVRAAALESDNHELIDDLQNLGTVQSVIKIAQEQLGLASPNAVAFQPES